MVFKPIHQDVVDKIIKMDSDGMQLNQITKELSVSIMTVRKYLTNYHGTLDRMANKSRGSSHYNWNGGRYTAKDGYVLIRVNGRYKHEHRILIEQFLGRRLKTSEHVHHKNGVKNDNRLENLEVLTASEHIKSHNKERLESGSHNTYVHLTAAQIIYSICLGGTLKEISRRLSIQPRTLHKKLELLNLTEWYKKRRG